MQFEFSQPSKMAFRKSPEWKPNDQSFFIARPHVVQQNGFQKISRMETQ
jgi:hypothetical protein